MKNIVIIDYGAGNVKSVNFAFRRLGYEPLLTDHPEKIKAADYVVFPGVGHAKAAMETIEAKGLSEVIRNLKQPVLGVCLGMQLMCRFSEEGNVKGLGIFDVDVKKFDEALKVPHMGWNDVLEGSSFMDNIRGQLYFVHSYYVPITKETIATCDYGITFTAALAKDNFYGCQFHPEKSSNLGEEVLLNFLNQ
ncbi:MAG: imidazole glycerol phosphate synthase subunit HisH [Bacteroidota bacterium]